MHFDAVLIEPRIRAMTEQGHWRNKTVDHYFEACLAQCPDKLAISAISVASGLRRDITYRELDLLAGRAAVGLVKLGTKRNDVVTCQLPNGWEFVATYLACARIGAVFNPVMPIFRERELNFILKHGESKVFLVPKVFRNFDHEDMAERLKRDCPHLQQVVVRDGAGANNFDALLGNPAFDTDPLAAHLSDTANRLGPNDVCQLIYTSGTTGEPKGVMHTANTLYANLIPYGERLELGADDVVFMASPMAHQTGFMYGLLMPICLQARAVLLDSWDKALAAKLLASEGLTFTMASTPFLLDVTNAIEATGARSTLRIFLCAGAAIPGPVVERAQRVLGAKIVSAWGMTENGATTTTNLSDPPERSINTDGYPLPGVDLQIHDSTGNPVGPGIAGDLYVRACSNFGGYLKRPHLNNVDAGGWFDTGDIARIDDMGYVRICGRSKDVIIRGGENIPVVEVEALLFKHPSIATVAIVGYPDERLGERACAFVTLREGHSFSFAEMTRFLESQKLARQYFPERLEIREALPATASGKIQKFVLRNALEEETVKG